MTKTVIFAYDTEDIFIFKKLTAHLIDSPSLYSNDHSIIFKAKDYFEIPWSKAKKEPISDICKQE